MFCSRLLIRAVLKSYWTTALCGCLLCSKLFLVQFWACALTRPCHQEASATMGQSCADEQEPVCAGCQQTRYGCRLPSICRGVTQCLKTKVTTLFFSSRCNALHPRNGSLPSIAYRELPLQLTPVVCTVFSDTELALVRHVAVGLGVLYDGAKGPNLS